MRKVIEALDDFENVRKLARRHLSACEAIYAAATTRADVNVAAHVARSALSIALNCAQDTSDTLSKEIAPIWYERLFSLSAEDARTREYLNRTVKWANEKMDFIKSGAPDNIRVKTSEKQ